MNKALFLLIFSFLLCAIGIGSAQAFYETKNSYYFMKDDGEFSDEEKDEEAFYVYQECAKNGMKNMYFNCECIAGAFRQIRDEDEFIRPQTTILSSLFRDDSRGCVNTEYIAGDVYKSCLNMARTTRYRQSDQTNEEYCTCAANDVARNFSKDARLQSSYILTLRSNAYSNCNPKTIQARKQIEEDNAKYRARK